MSAICHLGFWKFCSFCHAAFVGMPFCFLMQNFADIGQAVNELWPKKRFSRWRPSPCRILKMTVTGFSIWCCVPNFIKIGRFFTEIRRYNDSKWLASAILHFKNLQFLSCGFCRNAVLLPHKKIHWNRTIGYGQKRFSRWRSPPSWI